ncbi:lysophospholipid acyltransferase family protein [Candidatus Cardinium hertigii]|jgi:KDO2-lipid IV(A) lauroyltransferase|uniref:Lipid A biosynthesis acyltransferase n=1 Tax=Candidatus Cardinium hertigii TaxID=247481 RepID=A0A3N2QCK2_9BACT|nr:lysophospholipid acyltransferase family protein [Candidatus Cardinium hertigii]ROT47527.1 lipid A biosynthesis acyltransferase [Candidatus Cardinium hertigii]ROT47534.1 lipid A biosynthesis acyltransferase [Candidatus Cardinium hertigii]
MCICIVAYLLSALPLRLLYLISDLLFIVIYYLVGYRKKIVAQNLQNAFATKTAQEHKQIAKAFYQYLCDLFVEHIKALTITPQELLQHVTVSNREILENKQGKSILLVSGHFGNWEWIAHALALQTFYTICAGYQPLHHKGIDQLVMRLRTRFQRKAIQNIALLKYMLTYQGPPQAIAWLIDQAPLRKEHGYWTTFLAQPTAVSLTIARLAQKCNLPIFYVQIHQMQRGQYQAKLILLTKDPASLSVEEIAELYTRRLEKDILENPALWLWSHRRWK